MADKPTTIEDTQKHRMEEKQKSVELYRAQRDVEREVGRITKRRIKKLVKGEIAESDAESQFYFDEFIKPKVNSVVFFNGDYCDLLAHVVESDNCNPPSCPANVEDHCLASVLPKLSSKSIASIRHRAALFDEPPSRKALKKQDDGYSTRELRRIVSQMLQDAQPATSFILAKRLCDLKLFPSLSLHQLRVAIDATGIVAEHNRKLTGHANRFDEVFDKK